MKAAFNIQDLLEKADVLSQEEFKLTCNKGLRFNPSNEFLIIGCTGGATPILRAGLKSDAHGRNVYQVLGPFHAQDDPKGAKNEALRANYPSLSEFLEIITSKPVDEDYPYQKIMVLEHHGTVLQSIIEQLPNQRELLVKLLTEPPALPQKVPIEFA